MATMDIFTQDAFSTIQLTQALEKVPFQPNLLGSLGIFEPRPVRTTTVAIEERNGVLSIIQTSNRGAPLEQRTTERRNIRDFRTSRIAKGDTLMADELQNVRAFGSESELAAVQTEVARRYGGPTGILRDIELTKENMRLGALQGVVKDADGTTIYDWFSEWGISAPSEVDFLLGTATTDVRGKCSEVIRSMARASKGAFLPTTQVHALAGDGFYDKLINHASVRETYLNWTAAADLRQQAVNNGQSGAFGAFTFGGITWHNYRGTDDFTSQASTGTAGLGIDSTKAKFFPVGAPGVFQEAMSPAEFAPYVNTLGQPVYGLIIPDLKRQAFVEIEAYAYPLFMCTRPDMLQRGTTSN